MAIERNEITLGERTRDIVDGRSYEGAVARLADGYRESFLLDETALASRNRGHV